MRTPDDLGGLFTGPGRLARFHALSWRWQIPLGVLFATLGLLLRWTFAGALPQQGMPLITFYPGVALAGILGGWVCGGSTVIVSTIFALALFFGGQQTAAYMSLAAFLMTSAVISGLGEALHRSWAALGDIEVNRRETENLRVANERLRLANALAAIGAFEVEIRSLAIFSDDAIADMFGLPRGGSINSAVLKTLLSDDTSVLLAEATEQALSPKGDGRFRSELKIHRASDGAERVIAVQAQVLFKNGLPSRVTGVCRDVTEDRSAEQDARQRASLAEQLTALAGAAPGVIYSMRLGSDGWVSVPFVAPRVREVLGLEPAELMGDASAFLRRVHAQDFPEIETGMLAAARQLRRWSGVFRYIHPERGQIWIESHAMATSEQNGSVIWHGYLHDVSERVQSEQALRESEQRNIAFFRNANIGAAEIGPNLRFLRVNARYCEMTGYTEAQLLTMRATDLSAPESRTADEQGLVRHLNGEKPKYDIEKHFLRKDGTVFWAQVAGSLVQDSAGLPLYSVTLLSDVTERKLAEAALKKSRNHLLAIVEQAPVSIAMFDRRMNYLAASRCYVEEFGRGQTDLTSMNHYDLNPDLPSRWRATHARSLAGEYFSDDNDYWKDSGGREHWIRWTLSPWTAEAGEIGGIILLIEDISQQRRAEAAIRDSEERLREIGDNLPESFIFRFVRGADGHARFLHASAGVERILGISREEVVLNVDAVFNCFTSESLVLMREAEARSLPDLSDFRVECQFRHPAGGLGWAVIRWRPRQLDDGALVYDGMCTDVTRQKAIEAALEESENKFRSAFAAASVGFAMSAKEGAIIDANSAFCALTGYSVEELRRITMLDLLHPDDRSGYSAIALRATDPQLTANVMETRYVRRDGKVIWVRESASLTKDHGGQFKWIVHLVEDITQRKHSEAMVVQTLQHLRLILDGAKDGIVAYNKAGIIQSMNAAGLSIFGYVKEEIVGKNLSYLTPDYNNILFNIACDSDSEYVPILKTSEINGLRKDGSFIPIEISITKTEVDDERMYFGFMRELSERRRIESKIEKLTTQRLSAMGGMAAALAHELNQPLATVGIYLETARHRLQSLDDSRLDPVRNALDRAMGQVMRAGNVVSHLREFISHGEPDKTHQSLHSLIHEVMQNFDRQAESSIEFTLDLRAEIDEVLIDKSQISNVINSLLRNAQEALDGMSGANIHISTRLEGETLRATVADNGPGVPRDVLERLFEPLITSKPGGKGIGLSISKSIVEAHYGNITARNLDGGGASFSFTLPVATAETFE